MFRRVFRPFCFRCPCHKDCFSYESPVPAWVWLFPVRLGVPSSHPNGNSSHVGHRPAARRPQQLCQHLVLRVDAEAVSGHAVRTRRTPRHDRRVGSQRRRRRAGHIPEYDGIGGQARDPRRQCSFAPPGPEMVRARRVERNQDHVPGRCARLSLTRVPTRTAHQPQQRGTHQAPEPASEAPARHLTYLKPLIAHYLHTQEAMGTAQS
mgnify:CR=1 FL=1